MARLSAFAPHWAQRRAAAAAESRGQDPTQYIQTAPGGTPGRIQGLSALQRIGAMQAYRARTSLRPSAQPQEQSDTYHGELRRGPDGGLWRFNAATGRGERVGGQGEPETTTQDIAMQQFANRRRQLIDGGLSAPEASLAAGQEYASSPSFVGPTNRKPKKPSTLAHLSAAMQSRPRVNYMTPDVTKGMQAGASRRFSQLQA